jgi:hypothetical protein
MDQQNLRQDELRRVLLNVKTPASATPRFIRKTALQLNIGIPDYDPNLLRSLGL